MSAFRRGRPTAGKCGSAKEGISCLFPSRAGKLNQLCRVRADRRGEKGILVSPGDPDVLREAFAGDGIRASMSYWRKFSDLRWALYDREPLPIWTRTG